MQKNDAGSTRKKEFPRLRSGAARSGAGSGNRRERSRRVLEPKTGIIVFAVVAVAIFLTAYLRASAVAAELESELVLLAVAFGIITAVSMLIFETYLSLEAKELLVKPKKLFALASLIVASMLLTAATTLVSFAFTAVFIATILSGLLVSRRAAYTVTLLMASVSFMIALTSVGVGALDKPMAVACAVLTGGTASVLMLTGKSGRMVPIFSGAAGGGVGAVVLAAFQAVLKTEGSAIVSSCAWMLAGGVLCGIVATGLLPVFETLFDVATDARLNELMNNNNPLLKRLMLEAPGTYHHSLIVAVLAESAAELVGANALLCKTAAYYHDVGKLTSPRYFKENQGEYNIHDELPPEESARRIIAHQRDGAALLEKSRFPSELINIVGQHHGDSVVAYFYNKAIEASAEPETIRREDYAYGAEKPHSKEAAILMLADCCEAAVRAIKRPTAELIEERVRSVVRSLWQPDGAQLSECPLTAGDIRLIEKSFIKNLIAQYHERIEYPKSGEGLQQRAAAGMEDGDVGA